MIKTFRKNVVRSFPYINGSKKFSYDPSHAYILNGWSQWWSSRSGDVYNDSTSSQTQFKVIIIDKIWHLREHNIQTSRLSAPVNLPRLHRGNHFSDQIYRGPPGKTPVEKFPHYLPGWKPPGHLAGMYPIQYIQHGFNKIRLYTIHIMIIVIISVW